MLLAIKGRVGDLVIENHSEKSVDPYRVNSYDHSIKYKDEGGLREIGNLRADDLREQSEVTINFLYDLLYD